MRGHLAGRQRQAAAGPELIAQLPAPRPGDVAATSLPFCPGLEASVSGSPLPSSHGEMSLEGKTVRMNPVYQVGSWCQACGVQTSLLCSHCSPGSRVYCAHFTVAGKKAQAGSGTCTPSQSATKMGLCLDLDLCLAKAMPFPPCVSVPSLSLVTSELLPKEVSALSAEAFKQLLKCQCQVFLDAWAGWEVGWWGGGRILPAGNTHSPTDFIYFWRCRVACRILVSPPGTEPMPLAVKV